MDILETVTEKMSDFAEPVLHNWNHVPIDLNNPMYKLLKELGCDLSVEITNKYDAFIIGLQFIFACGFLYFFLKFLFKVMSILARGKF